MVNPGYVLRRACTPSYGMRRRRRRSPTDTRRVISPHIPADDYARLVSPGELTGFTVSLAAERPVIVCSALPDGIDDLRLDLGNPRVDALLRELTTFVRRNLRGSDAVAVMDDELILVLDADSETAIIVCDRLMAAVRGHLFASGSADRSLRVTLALGVAFGPEQGGSLDELLPAARHARESAGSDATVVALVAVAPTLDLGRFVGRAEQLARFSDYLDDMVRGVGRVVAVTGERGVGASALVKSLQPEVRLRGGSLVVGRCHQHVLPASYALWSEVLRGVRRLPVKSTRVWRELPLLDPALENASHETSGGSKTHLLEELADFLRLAAQQRPLVLLLEDLQWADAASWDALEYLITQLESERILIALTFVTGTLDDDALDRWHGLATRPRHHEMPLTRLTRDDAKRWLEGAMRTVEPGRELLAYLYRHTEGNPLLLTQLVRDLQEGGFIAWHGTAWQWSAVADLPAHVDLDTIVGRRLDRLAPDARALLEVAAVLGRGAVEPLTVDMAGLDPAAGRESLRQLVASELLVSSHERIRPTYVVAHDEVARIVRNRLSPTRRAELHVRVARGLAAHAAASAAEIAGHFEIAGLRAETHRYALAGADEALALHENGSAAELLGAAERAAPSPAALAEVRVRMASLAEVAGRYEEAEGLADQALEWFVAQGDRVMAVQIKRTRTLVRIKRGKGAAETLAELLALEKEAVDAGADMERAAVLLLVAQMHWRLGDIRAAQRVAEEAVTIAEQGDDPPLLADACNRLAATIQFEDPARAREMFSKSFEIATTLGDPFRRMRGLNNLGVLELLSNNWDEARRVLTMAADQARTAGLLESWGRAELNLGVLAGRIGDYDGAARALSEALRLTSMVQNSEEQLYATYNMAHVERERGRYREAIDLYELVTALAARIGQVEVQAGAQAGMGLCYFLMDDMEEARRSLAATDPLMERLVDWFQGREMEAALRLGLLLLDGRSAEAGALFERMLAMAGRTDVYGAAWLTAEFGERLRVHFPEAIEVAVRRYAALPEVLDNPRIRDRFAVLKIDSNVTIDRIG